MHWLNPFLNPPSDSKERQCTTYDGDLMPGLISSLAILGKKLTDYVTAANIRIPRQNYTRKHTGLRKMKHSHRLPLSVFRSRQHITRQCQSLLHICSCDIKRQRFHQLHNPAYVALNSKSTHIHVHKGSPTILLLI